MKSVYNEFRNINAIWFEVGGHQHIYDSFSNKFLKVDEVVIDILDDTFELEREEIIEKYSFKYHSKVISDTVDNISKLKQDGNLLQKLTIPRFSISSKKSTVEKVKEKVNNNLYKLVLNVTEDCNYRCEYCVYSGGYEGNRVHNRSNALSWGTAKRAIDFFIRRSNLSRDRYISFYGGEPLLGFDLIKRCITYAQRLDPEIKFAITTNGSLLDEGILEFISRYDLELTISLDGPRIIHDKFRRRPNKEPTFDLVFKKLKLVKDKFPDYFRSQVNVNAVLAPHEDVDFNALNDFFANHPVVKEIKGHKKITVSVINPDPNIFVEKYDYNSFYYKFLSEMFKLYKKYHEHSLDINEIPVAKALLSRNIRLIHFRENKPLSEYTYFWPNGICIPGMRTLFVSPDGSFYPCEKLYDYGSMCIGNVISGFDHERIAYYIDEYSKTAIQECKDCWLYRLCGICFLSICQRQDGGFMPDKRRGYCDAQKHVMSLYFKLYISIREKQYDIFDYLLEE